MVGHTAFPGLDHPGLHTMVVGDTVLISKYGGTDIKLDGEEYLILREDDILAVLKK